MDSLPAHISVAPTWLWIAFNACVFVLLIIDLSLFGKGEHKNPRKVALIESSIWISIALLFNLWFGLNFGKDLGFEFLAGYLIEKSLSVDNLFIILLIFGSFKIPAKLQHKVLFYGILGAVVMRAFFIIVGAHLLARFHGILYVFGLILVGTAVKFLLEKDGAGADVQDSWSIRTIRKFIPTTKQLDGQKFFTRENGLRKATPLFLALVAIEVTDLIFAVDSIPAVFAVTQDAFVAFASNILAILGLRALYFVLADLVSKLKYLKQGLAVILGFIGIKMLLVDVIKIPSWISLLVIFSILFITGWVSWLAAKKAEASK